MKSLFAIEPSEFESELEFDSFLDEFEFEVPPINVANPEFVRWVQTSLNKLSNAKLSLDGIWGPITRAAVRTFQQQQGLTPDGIAGGQTTQRIQQLLSGAATPSCACVAFKKCGEVLNRFPLDVAAVQSFHQPLIEQIARCVVESQTSIDPIRSLNAVGHTDTAGPDAYNQTLGLRRAEEVRRHLLAAIDRIQRGLAARIPIVTETRGKSQTIPGDAAGSRRVVVSLRTSAPPPPPPPPPRRGRCHLQITSTPSPLVLGFPHAPYAWPLAAANASGAINWSIIGGSLPPGVSLGAKSGLISGIPTTAGIYRFRIRARDAVGCTSDKDSSITVQGVPTPAQPCSQREFDKLKSDCTVEAMKCVAGRAAQHIIQNLKHLPGALQCARMGNPYAIALCVLLKGGRQTIDNLLRTHTGLQECRQRLDICQFNARTKTHCR